jgi:hypothetical protein
MEYAVEMDSGPKFYEDRFKCSTVILEGEHIYTEKQRGDLMSVQ